ncbi:hypothetical protein NPX13_g6037 [Xylaria arbuscula]|uniref:Uncharacterized protein n=1 Tax=Xylaria arbuscula TaxID=114810 RepID=A0A9W8NCK5_9PEZI|nr:hypothetical protein NPX13_g6037 [Xylaria arbuscula]
MLISRIFQALIALPIVLAVPHAAPPQKTPGYDPKNPYNATVIRFSKMGCWDMKLDYNNLIKATEKLKDWGKQKGKKIPAGGVRGQDQVWEAAWICNCKHFYKDHAPAAEIDEAFRIVNQTCHHGSDGTMNGGWVWSKKWQKSWNFLSSIYLPLFLPSFLVRRRKHTQPPTIDNEHITINIRARLARQEQDGASKVLDVSRALLRSHALRPLAVFADVGHQLLGHLAGEDCDKIELVAPC